MFVIEVITARRQMKVLVIMKEIKMHNFQLLINDSIIMPKLVFWDSFSIHWNDVGATDIRDNKPVTPDKNKAKRANNNIEFSFI